MKDFRRGFSINVEGLCIVKAFLIGLLIAGCSTNHFLNGVRLLREAKDYDGAIAEFTKAIESNPDYEGPYWGRGTAHR